MFIVFSTFHHVTKMFSLPLTLISTVEQHNSFLPFLFRVATSFSCLETCNELLLLSSAKIKENSQLKLIAHQLHPFLIHLYMYI